MTSEVRVGDIARCQKDRLGLVLTIRADKKTGVVYEGIHIDDGAFGKKWQSWKPKRIIPRGVWLLRALRGDSV